MDLFGLGVFDSWVIWVGSFQFRFFQLKEFWTQLSTYKFFVWFRVRYFWTNFYLNFLIRVKCPKLITPIIKSLNTETNNSYIIVHVVLYNNNCTMNGTIFFFFEISCVRNLSQSGRKDSNPCIFLLYYLTDPVDLGKTHLIL